MKLRNKNQFKKPESFEELRIPNLIQLFSIKTAYSLS